MRGSTMRKGMTFGLWSLAAAGATLGLMAVRAEGQDSGGVTIYRGGTAKEAGIKLVNWGSGAIVEDTQLQYSGSRSLKLSTHGMYQGASLVLASPINMGAYAGNKNSYLQFVLQIPDTQSNTNFGGGLASGGGLSGSGGSFPGFGSGSSGPGGRGGGFPGLGGPGGGYPGVGGGRAGNTATQKAQNIEKIRVVLLTSTNHALEFLLPMEYARTAEQQWKQLSIPVAAIPGLKSDDAQIKEIRLFGDAPGTIYIGQVRVVNDVTPLTVDRIGEKVVPRNSRNPYTVKASAGIIPLKISWDFDESDGIQDEKTGRSVIFSYYKMGDFVATVTVSDVYGVLEPKTIKFKVHVTP